MAKNGIYIYGIVPNFYGAEHFRSLEYAGVYAIPLQNISAIVSDWDIDSVDFSNAETFAQQLVHHQLTIERVMTLGFTMILPMKLGTIVNAKEEVKTILAKGHDLFISSFNHIENMTEIDLTVTWADFGGILKELSFHPEVIALRESIFKKDNFLLQADQVKTGMLLRERLHEKNKNIELKILNVLTSFSTNLKLHEVLNDQMISNAAFLINRNLKEKFKQMVGQLKEEFNGMLNFKLAGPLPCYSFFTIEVKELSPEKIAFAKKELGLSDEPSEPVIKRAYLDYARLFQTDARHDNGDKERFKRINMAYHTLLEYSMAVKQASHTEFTSLVNKKTIQKMYLVKMKD
jgi:hypothetical protein